MFTCIFLIFFQAFFSIFIVIVAQPSRFYIETYMSAENRVWLTLRLSFRVELPDLVTSANFDSSRVGPSVYPMPTATRSVSPGAAPLYLSVINVT